MLDSLRANCGNVSGGTLRKGVSKLKGPNRQGGDVSTINIQIDESPHNAERNIARIHT